MKVDITPKNEAGLPTWEIGANFVLWIGAVSYSIYQFYLSTQALLHIDDPYNDFDDRWGLKKDISDIEWEIMMIFIRLLLPWLLLHAFITELAKRLKIAFIPLIHLIISAVFLFTHLNYIIITFIFLQIIPFYFLTSCNKIPLIWFYSAIDLVLITWFKFLDVREFKYIEIDDFEHVVCMLCMFWAHLRCLSFCIDKIKKKHTGSILDFFGYVFYMPTLVTGPFISCKDYAQSKVFQYNIRHRVTKLLKDLLRVAFWGFITELSLHFIYVNATAFHIEYVKSFEPWTMYGYGYTMGQYFHLKFVVIYGFGSAFAHFEGASVPKSPKCIGRIHLYSDMWRYFDEGLYKFLLKYIYVPTLRNNSLASRTFSSFLCFVFIYIWHGVQDYVLIWTILNFAGVSLENIAKLIYNKTLLDNTYISDSWKRRISAACAAPLLALSAMNSFYLLGGKEVGDAFFNKFFLGSLKTNSILIFFLYNCSQVSIEVKIWESLRNKTTTPINKKLQCT